MKSIFISVLIFLMFSCSKSKGIMYTNLPEEYNNIVVVVTHPDDEIYMAGGSVLKWMEEGRNVSFVYVSDGRAAYTWAEKNNEFNQNEILDEIKNITEEELAQIRMNEVDKVMSYWNVPDDNYSKLMLPDQGLSQSIDKGSSLIKEYLDSADLIVMLGKNDPHIDHSSTYKIVIKAVKEMELINVKFLVPDFDLIEFTVPVMVSINVGDKSIRSYEALLMYESQKYLKDVYSSYPYVKDRIVERFSLYNYSDIGKYSNF